MFRFKPNKKTIPKHINQMVFACFLIMQLAIFFYQVILDLTRTYCLKNAKMYDYLKIRNDAY